MKLFIAKNKEKGDKKAFEVIKNKILVKPNSLIGFAVGKTTDGLYKLISKDIKKNKKTWSKLRLFQIDENLGFGPNNPLSFNSEIGRELKNLIKILPKKNIFLMDGTKDPKTTIADGSRFIKKNKGMDLIILGLGPEYDPHIAYNTTGKSGLNSKMRVVELHLKIAAKLNHLIETCRGMSQQKINAGKGTRPRAPTKGITLGIRDILNSKKALLIAYGKDKTKSIKKAFSGKVDMKKASASALQLHKDLSVIVDKEAVSGLLW